MKINPEVILDEAKATGFDPVVLEKVVLLLQLLDEFQEFPSLGGRLILKGGTALNLFVFDIPRLSVDIDLNYVGAQSRDEMLADRLRVEQDIQYVFEQEGFIVKRIPREHAGGKWRLWYESGVGQDRNLEVDLNFMYRVPLWPTTIKNSHYIGDWRATKIPVLDLHELAAGKLTALLERDAARDLFDSYRLLQMDAVNSNQLRTAFVVYGAMSRKDWRTVTSDDVTFNATDWINKLIPMLSARSPEVQEDPNEYGTRLVEEIRNKLSVVLPFSGAEQEFLDLLLDWGQIDSTLLTADTALQERIQSQPLLEWKALNVRRYKGLAGKSQFGHRKAIPIFN